MTSQQTIERVVQCVADRLPIRELEAVSEEAVLRRPSSTVFTDVAQSCLLYTSDAADE